MLARLRRYSDEDEATCKVCYDAKINTVIIPCGHMALCFECGKLVKGPGKKNECAFTFVHLQ